MTRSTVVAGALLVWVAAGCAGAGGGSAFIGEAPRRAESPTTALAAPADPSALAAELIRVETAIRASDAGRIAALGQAQQSAYAMLVRHPDWQPTVIDAVPPPLRAAVEANLRAGNELKALAPPPKPDLPPWRIVPPAPAAELLAEYHQAEAVTGVGWEYLAAIHLVETRMGRIRGTSVAGAQGPMQFIPSTWALYGGGGDIESNHDSIEAAARMLKDRGAPGDMAHALYAYNPSGHYVRAVSAYAEVMRAEPNTYFAYHEWQVFYGDRLLPEGYGS